MGREPATAQNYFTEAQNSNGIAVWECDFCAAHLSIKASGTRKREHLDDKCLRNPKRTRSTTKQATSEGTTQKDCSRPQGLRQTTLSARVVMPVTKSEKDLLDGLCMQAIAENMHPFELFSKSHSPAMYKLITELMPGYEPPNRDRVANGPYWTTNTKLSRRRCLTSSTVQPL